MALNPNDLAVETFVTSDTLSPSQPIGGPKTYEPGCTAFVELCPTDTTVVGIAVGA
ncbi:MAG TPA: hypothetical protein VFJ82_09685 [Longimicrobium sp.]|nr:hypothetical protein [Longimicrobium sp.]